MRLVLAELFVYVIILSTVGMWSTHAGHRAVPWSAGLLMLTVMPGALAIALRVFNRSRYRSKPRRKPLAAYLADLEADGMLDRQRFHATRAFGVAEFEDEGLHYYIALVDGRVLYLSGQYLYDSEPIDGDPDISQPRRFPNTAFDILRHRETGEAVDIACFGMALEPECMAAPYGGLALSEDHPADGQVIVSKCYDDLKNAHAAAMKKK